MIHLYLLRHGIAVPHGTPEVEDDDRPLTRQGEQHVYDVAHGLRDLKLKLDRIVSSPLPRALRTAQITAEVLGLSKALETADSLRAQTTAAAIRGWLDTRTEDRLMIVGHNPSFNDLIGLLACGEARPLCDLRKGGVAALVRKPDGKGMEIDWIARPRLFRRLT